MNDRIFELTKLTLEGKMAAKANPMDFDREDIFLPRQERESKQLCQYILNQEPVLTKYSKMTGFFKCHESIVGDAFRRMGHKYSAEVRDSFYLKPLHNLSTMEWQHATADYKKVLEMGVDGIIFPMVRNAQEAEQVISTTLYPPYGERGFGPMNAIDYGFRNVQDYTQNNRQELCRFIQVEHKDTLEDLDKIMENPDIDGYIFGPNDLSGSYNMLGQVFSDHVTQVIRQGVEKLHAAGKYVAIASGGNSRDVLEHWESFAPDMLVAGADFDFLREGARQNRQRLEEIHKK